MKRKNVAYEYETNRTKIEDIDFEQMLMEFNKASRERRKKNKSKLKNHKR